MNTVNADSVANGIGILIDKISEQQEEINKLTHVLETLGHEALVNEEYLKDTGFYNQN